MIQLGSKIVAWAVVKFGHKGKNFKALLVPTKTMRFKSKGCVFAFTRKVIPFDGRRLLLVVFWFPAIRVVRQVDRLLVVHVRGPGPGDEQHLRG